MASEKSRFSSEAGFSLIEVLAATVVMSVALVGLAQLFALSTTANTTARTNTYAALLAQQHRVTIAGEFAVDLQLRELKDLLREIFVADAVAKLPGSLRQQALADELVEHRGLL